MAGDDAAPSEPQEPESTAADVEPVTATDFDHVDGLVEPDDATNVESILASRSGSHVKLALIAGLVAVLVLGGLTGWLGYRAHQSTGLAAQRQTFLQVGRQAAINLTTLDFEHIDADVQRILDSATGSFYDDFLRRAPAFEDVVRRVRSKSVGTVTEAAIEAGDVATQAEVLVAVTVKSMIAGQPEQQPRSWRMRILVQTSQGETKVSNVEFVS